MEKALVLLATQIQKQTGTEANLITDVMNIVQEKKDTRKRNRRGTRETGSKQDRGGK